MAVKVLHALLLNTIVVAFKVFPLESYTQLPASSPPFKTILELVLWNGLQSCRCIIPDLIVMKMPSFQYFLYLREQKKSLGLDPLNRQGVPKQLFVLWLKTPSQTVRCEQLHCRDARSTSCWQTFGSFPCNFFKQHFQYFQIVNLVDCLSSWYKFIMNNPSNIKKSQQHYFDF